MAQHFSFIFTTHYLIPGVVAWHSRPPSICPCWSFLPHYLPLLWVNLGCRSDEPLPVAHAPNLSPRLGAATTIPMSSSRHSFLRALTEPGIAFHQYVHEPHYSHGFASLYSQSVQAAITKVPWTGWLVITFSSHIPGHWEIQDHGTSRLGVWWGPTSCSMAFCYNCTWQKDQGSFLGSLL